MKPHRTIGIALAALGAIVACITFFGGATKTPQVRAFRALPDTAVYSKGNTFATGPFFELVRPLVTAFMKDSLYPESEDIERFGRMTETERKTFVSAFAKRDPIAAWDFLLTAWHEDIPSERWHDYGHIVGKELYTHYGVSGMEYCDNEFNGACFHGLIAEATRHSSLLGLPDLVRFCNQSSTTKDSVTSTLRCVHGLGHGIASIEGDVSRALEDCAAMPQYIPLVEGDPVSEKSLNLQESGTCIEGVFMEMSTNGWPQMSSSQKMWGTCMNLDPKYQRECARFAYLNQERTITTMDDLSALCADAPTETLWGSCMSINAFGEIAHTQNPPHQGSTVAQAIAPLRASCGQYQYVPIRFEHCIGTVAQLTVYMTEFGIWKVSSTTPEKKTLGELVSEVCSVLSRPSRTACTKNAFAVRAMFRE